MRETKKAAERFLIFRNSSDVTFVDERIRISSGSRNSKKDGGRFVRYQKKSFANFKKTGELVIFAQCVKMAFNVFLTAMHKSNSSADKCSFLTSKVTTVFILSGNILMSVRERNFICSTGLTSNTTALSAVVTVDLLSHGMDSEMLGRTKGL